MPDSDIVPSVRAVLGSSLIQDAAAGGWWQFRAAREIVVATRVDDVLDALRHTESRVNRDGSWAAGFISYEAGPAFDPAIRARPPGDLPLLWLGLYDEPRLVQLPQPATTGVVPQYRWQPSVDRDHYDRAIAQIRALIAAGDTYQVNYTLRLRAPSVEDPFALFLRMCHANEPRHGAYLECGRFIICSASPELFLQLAGNTLTSRPMKGTTGRGLWLAQDEAAAQRLGQSLKDRAENVMIVDMVRNDLGRISTIGSVRVPNLFELERYPTLWQMTSTVTAQASGSLCDILRALFPPASITGAPKARTTEIIAELETTPRGVYTGCIGYLAPGRRAQFNVAIRTAAVDLERRSVEYGVGGGVVWDSTSQGEYEECLLKARIVTGVLPEFSLLETLLWEPGSGYLLLEEHLRRLAESARYFGMAVDLVGIRHRLAAVAHEFPAQSQRVRLTVDRAGRVSLEAAPLLDATAPQLVRLAIAPAPINSLNPFLYHKTTHRKVYDDARATCIDCDDIVLWNENGDVTETTIANIVIERDGEMVTPPVESGLLPGVYRGLLLAQGKVREARVTLDDLCEARRICVVNSVRRCRRAFIAPDVASGRARGAA